MSSQWNAICDRCGFQYKNHQLRKEWTGYMVCDRCFETRHPQEFVKARPDQKPLPWTRPEPSHPDVGVAINATTQTTVPTGTFTSNNNSYDNV